MASRFGNGIVKLNALRDRVTGAMDTHRRRLKRSGAHRSRRRMSEAQVGHADALYASLEADHLASEDQRPQLPKEHALSWLHDLVDWPSAVNEGSRLLAIVRERHKMRETGGAHHDIVKKHPTGWSWLDNAAMSQPTIVGDALRRVLYRKETGADPPWHHKSLRHRVSRRLEDGDAARLAHDAEAPPPHFGGLRRLGVAFMESTVAAPFAFYDTLLPSGATVKGSEITFWEATLRYVVAGTVGCYFVAPANEPSKTQGEDGTEDGDKLKILRPSEEKLCFPAVRWGLRAAHGKAPLLAPAPTDRLRFPVRSCRLPCPTCTRFARRRAPRAWTSTRSTTWTTARAMAAPCSSCTTTSSRGASTRATRTRCCPTRRCCAAPRRSTRS